MKALEVREPFGTGALRIVERPDPEPQPGQVVLRMSAWALNYRDVLVVGGKWRPAGARVPLSDAVGRVVAVGRGVTRVKAGDRVAPIFYPRWIDGPLTDEKGEGAPGGRLADGFGAEYVAVDAESVVHVPAHLTDEEAATLGTAGVTAWNAVEVVGDVKPGQTVVVVGTGGVSLFALQLAHLAGARVIVTSGSDAKLERARALGAAEGINSRRTAEWPAVVHDLAPGGADVVVDTVGALDSAIAALRINGIVSFVGFLQGSRTSVDLIQLMNRGARIQGIDVGSRRMFEELNAAIARHGLRPVVDHVFPFDEAPAALRHLESGQHFGKVCLRA